MKKLEESLLTHVDAAYNLARWLTRNDQDAADVVQESYLRAFRFIEDLKGADTKPWLLQIVRNTAYSWLRKHRVQQAQVPIEEEDLASSDPSPSPKDRVLQQGEQELVRSTLEALAPEYREVLILRELEELSYQEIADISGVPVGTVMSRLSRGRAKLLERLRKTQEASS